MQTEFFPSSFGPGAFAARTETQKLAPLAAGQIDVEGPIAVIRIARPAPLRDDEVAVTVFWRVESLAAALAHAGKAGGSARDPDSYCIPNESIICGGGAEGKTYFSQSFLSSS
jgi:hypothetical protein